MRGLRAALALAAALAAGAAAANAPMTSPRPEPRPATASAAAAPVATATLSPAPALPRPRPEAPTVARAATSPITAVSALAVATSLRPPSRPQAAAAAHLQRVSAGAVRGQPAPEAITGSRTPTAALCGVPGLQGRMLGPVVSQVQGCGIARPVQVTAVDGVRLSTPTTLDCDAARALARWVREAAQPAIGRSSGGLAELRVAAHYVCRTRNHQAGARISEHGRGRAIDISGLTLADGTAINVLRDWRGRGTYCR
jgi:hypothetical protein